MDVTDITIGPGLYYIALVDGTDTATYIGWAPTAPMLAAAGVLTEALGSVALPATATWGLNQTLARLPNMGVLLETTVA